MREFEHWNKEIDSMASGVDCWEQIKTRAYPKKKTGVYPAWQYTVAQDGCGVFDVGAYAGDRKHADSLVCLSPVG